MTRFFERIFNIPPHYENEEFSEFVLPSGSRVAFFKPTGKTVKYFKSEGDRSGASFGVTVEDVDAFYGNCVAHASEFNIQLSGEPKEHPWGEKSFLLIDGDGNRWEITQSPSADGALVNRE